MQFSGFFFLRIGNRKNIRFTSLRFPPVHLHFQNIHHFIETRTRIHRILHQNHFLSERRLCMLHRLFKISFFMIQLVDDKNHRFIQLLSMTADNLRPDFHTPHGIHHHHSSIGNIQRRNNPSDKIISPRSIYKIQLLFFPFSVQHRRKNRRTVFLLHRPVVRGRVFSTHATPARDDPALVHHRFSQCGLSRPRTAYKSNILDFIRIIGFHSIRL